MLARANASQHNNAFGNYSQLVAAQNSVMTTPIASNAVPGPSTSFYNATSMTGGSVSFPLGSVEAITANAALLKRKRPKVLTRDITQVCIILEIFLSLFAIFI